MALDPRARPRLRAVLTPEDFHSAANRTIWEAVVALDAAGEPVDVVTIAHWLRAHDQWQRIGGIETIARITEDTPVQIDYLEHARRVVALAGQRAIVARCQRAVADGYGDIGALSEWSAALVRDVQQIARRSSPGSAVWLAESAIAASAKVFDTMNRRGQITGVSTGLHALDAATAGMHTGDFIVLTAPSGGGKTALATTIAINVALRGDGVGFVELEMPHEQITQRMCCAIGRVNFHAVRLGKHVDRDYGAFVDAAAKVRTAPLRIDDGKPKTFDQLRASAQAMADALDKRGLPMRLLVVDYVQKVDGSALVPPRSTRERELAKVAEHHVRLSEELRIPILALAQTNDDGEIRESRAILHEATSWWHLEIAKSHAGSRAATVEIKKQRHGPVPAEARFWFHPSFVWFDDEDSLLIDWQQRYERNDLDDPQ
jgi:replicative DNA helicase